MRYISLVLKLIEQGKTKIRICKWVTLAVRPCRDEEDR